MKFFLTGGAGFVASNMTARLVGEGHTVTCYDNLSLGRREHLDGAIQSGRCTFVEADLLDLETLRNALQGHDVVIHLAANSDILQGARDPGVDLRQGVLVTYNVLDAMRHSGVRRILFSSSSVVYGEPERFPTPEDYGPLLPISFYGASKLAGEGLITAFVHNFGFQAWIYRFGNIVGTPATHGVILDFVRKLQRDPGTLEVLGDGRQSKPYLHVSDCVDGMLYGFRHAGAPVNVFNLAVDDWINVDSIARAVIEAMGLTDVVITHTGGSRGWPGDVPKVALSPEKFVRMGWRASMPSAAAVARAAMEIVRQENAAARSREVDPCRS